MRASLSVCWNRACFGHCSLSTTKWPTAAVDANYFCYFLMDSKTKISQWLGKHLQKSIFKAHFVSPLHRLGDFNCANNVLALIL